MLRALLIGCWIWVCTAQRIGIEGSLTALTSPTPDAGNAVLALRRLIAIDSQGAKTFSSSCSLTSILLAVLFRSGMSPIVTDVENLPALPAVPLDRDAVCELVCAIASAAAPYVRLALSDSSLMTATRRPPRCMG